MLSIIILLEILLSCFIVWGILNEEKLVNFEDHVFSDLQKLVKNIIIVKK
jgi:hypothetical protein